MGGTGRDCEEGEHLTLIKVTFTESGKKLSLRVEGHAGYADIGEDTVCASATILAFTVAQFVKSAGEKGDLVASPEIKLERGDAFISCEPTEETAYETHNMYAFAKLGYQLLAHNYPQYVKLML